jgi:hypothetical protein
MEFPNPGTVYDRDCTKCKKIIVLHKLEDRPCRYSHSTSDSYQIAVISTAIYDGCTVISRSELAINELCSCEARHLRPNYVQRPATVDAGTLDRTAVGI